MPDDQRLIPGTRRKKTIGIATPATTTPWSLSHRCTVCKGWILPGEPACLGCMVDSGERHGIPSLEEMGLGKKPGSVR